MKHRTVRNTTKSAMQKQYSRLKRHIALRVFVILCCAWSRDKRLLFKAVTRHRSHGALLKEEKAHKCGPPRRVRSVPVASFSCQDVRTVSVSCAVCNQRASGNLYRADCDAGLRALAAGTPSRSSYRSPTVPVSSFPDGSDTASSMGFQP